MTGVQTCALPIYSICATAPAALASSICTEGDRPGSSTGAIRAYAKLATAGIHHLTPDGILVACSCSAHVTAEEFFGAVRGAAGSSGRKFTELQTTRHAPDHAATFKEADYLKGIYLRFG